MSIVVIAVINCNLDNVSFQLLSTKLNEMSQKVLGANIEWKLIFAKFWKTFHQIICKSSKITKARIYLTYTR